MNNVTDMQGRPYVAPDDPPYHDDDPHDAVAPVWHDVPQIREPVTIRVQLPDLPPPPQPMLGTIIAQIFVGIVFGLIVGTLIFSAM